MPHGGACQSRRAVPPSPRRREAFEALACGEGAPRGVRLQRLLDLLPVPDPAGGLHRMRPLPARH